MQKPFLKYGGSIFIKNDLKRLKKWKSLKDDVYNCYKIIAGGLCEQNWPPPYNFGGGLITETSEFLCFKERQAITNPFLSPSEGARIIYGLTKKSKVFLPLIVFGACEEKETYKINNKKFSLTSSNFAKIINEKLKNFDLPKTD